VEFVTQKIFGDVTFSENREKSANAPFESGNEHIGFA